MASSGFVISFFLMFLAAALTWLLEFLCVPQLKASHPAHYAAAGSPSPWTSSIANFRFLSYLLGGHFRSLADPRLARKLNILLLAWCSCWFFMVLAFGFLVAGLGA